MCSRLRLPVLLTSLVVFTISNVVPTLFGQTFDDPSLTNQDNFGFAISIDSQRILIGDRRDDTAGTNVGQAHMFDRNTGQFIRTFQDPTPSIQDNFGSAVDFELNFVVIGAPLDANQGLLTGQAYLFDAANGALLHTFQDPTLTQADFFGSNVGISGNRVVISAPGDDTNGASSGQVHIFDAVTGKLMDTLNDPTPTAFDSFGDALAVDGDLILIGEPGDDTMGFNVGQAHLFDATNGNFIRSFDDPSPTGSDSFGAAVAMDGDLVLIGAPGDDSAGSNTGEAYLFNVQSGDLIDTLKGVLLSQDDAFGSTVAISGNTAVVSSTQAVLEGDAVGQVFVFNGNGFLKQIFNSPNGQDGDEFGFAVAVDDDIAYVGSPNDDSSGPDIGRVYSFALFDIILGDVNDDGAVDLLDIAPFVDLLTSGEYSIAADTNGDGIVNLLDIAIFVAILSGA